MNRNDDPQMRAIDMNKPQSAAENGPRLVPSTDEIMRVAMNAER